MEDIIRTEEGQRLFDFLDMHWGAILLSPFYDGSWQSITEVINRTIDTENEFFDLDLLELNEYTDIVQYFLTMGSSY